MITSSGAKCDVCGDFILPLDPAEMVHTFSIPGIAQDLHCDNKCKPLLARMAEEQSYDMLPDGPLRRCFEKADAEGRVIRD